MKSFLIEGATINLPDLAEFLKLSSPFFKVQKVMEGGMGSCAKIIDENGQAYAIKTIHTSLISNSKSKARYYEEIKKWKTLSACSGVVEVVGVTAYNEIPCVISRWMEGGELSPYVKINDKTQFYKTIDQIVTSLKWAYDKYSIIHRDLKPSNILLDTKRNAYIGDWGLAKDLTETYIKTVDIQSNPLDLSLTSEHSFIGTAYYASPEQICGEENIDFRADLYSIGCMMYEWETGNVPFNGTTLQEITSAHLYNTPDKIPNEWGYSNFNVDEIIYKCLQKKPKDRYQSYDDFLEDFRCKAKLYENNFVKTEIRERYSSIKYGVGNIQEKIFKGEIKDVVMSTSKYCAIPLDEAKVYLDEAQVMLSLGKYSEAIKTLKGFFDKDLFSECQNVWFVENIANNLAYAYIFNHNYEEADRCLSIFEKWENKPSGYFVNLSNLRNYQGRFIEAIDVCNEGLIKYPNDTDIQGNLTNAYLYSNQYELALYSAQKRLNIEHCLKSLIEIGDVCRNIGISLASNDFPNSHNYLLRALNYYKEAESYNPIHLNCKRNIANILFWLRKFEESSIEVNVVSDIAKGLANIDAFYMARNLLWVSCFQGCVEFCDKWIKNFPDDIPLQRIRAEAIVDGFCIGKYKDGNKCIDEDVIEFFEKIINNTKERELTDYIFLGRMLYWKSRGNKEIEAQALNVYSEAAKLYNKDPERWRIYFQVANYYIDYGDYYQALYIIKQAIQVAPWREKCYETAALIYEKLGQDVLATEMKFKSKSIRDTKAKLYGE